MRYITRLTILVSVGLLGGLANIATAQTVTNLHSFGGPSTEGHFPFAGLVQGSDGNFYGTTTGGGTNDPGIGGDGTVFKITPAGTLTTLVQFGSSLIVGRDPQDALVQGSDGNFYGTTFNGGTNNLEVGGDGTVFKITPAGTLTTLVQFGGTPKDGLFPLGGLTQGSDGNFYGTAGHGGGTNDDGIVFKITPAGTLTTLYSFGSLPTDGQVPEGRLVQGSDGNFYGTTIDGGTNNDGTVFKITPAGTLTTLYQFGGVATDGQAPLAGLTHGTNGNFYGTTDSGGTNFDGTAFMITSAGSLTTLYQFGSLASDGQFPASGLMQGSDGNFYGAAEAGGTNNAGTVFKMTPLGASTTLYQFDGVANDGVTPFAVLVQGSDGNFYGTTSQGGTNNLGTVFKVSITLNPPANQISAIQRSGTNIVVSIPSVACETYQLQSSTSMNPTNWVNVAGASVTNSIGALMTLTNFGGASSPRQFYRFDITP